MAEFKCYRCGDGLESGKSFIPIDPPMKNRRWCCTQCARVNEKENTKNILGDNGLEVTRVFDSEFLKGDE